MAGEENLGRAVLALSTDDSELSKGLNTAEQKAQGWAKGLGSTVGNFVTAGVVLAGVGKLVSVLGDCAAEAAEAQRIEAQLNAVLKSTGGVAGVTARQVKSLAGELSNMTGVEDDSIVAAENVMLTFTQVGQQVFPDAIRAAMDMSAAMGQDLQSSIVQVGKALQDPVAGMTALRRVGVSFSEAQQQQIKDLIATNDLMGAQKLILAELNTEFAGSAVAAGNTYSGAVNKLNNELGNLKETIGAGIIVAIQPVVQGATNVVSGLTAQLQIDTGAAEGKVDGLHGKLQNLKGQLEALEKGWGPESHFLDIFGQRQVAIDQLKQQIADLEVELTVAQTSIDNSGASMLGLGDAAGYAANRINAAATAAASMSAQEFAIATGSYYRPSSADMTDPELRRVVTETEVVMRAAKTASTTAARQAASAWDSAFQRVSSRIGGYLDDAISKSKGLWDASGNGGKGLFEPGAGGPFENIYRAMAIAKGGIDGDQEAQWAQELGLTPQTAQQIVQDFQNGIMSEGVKKLIDMPMLIDQVRIQDQATKMKDAFVNEIAKQAGVGKSVVQALIEPNAAQTAATATQAGQLATDVATQFAGQAAQFQTTGKAWMDQLAAGIRGQIPVLTQAANEVVQAFLTAMRNAITLAPPATTGPTSGMLNQAPGAPAMAGAGVTVNGMTVNVPSGDPAAVSKATQDGLLRAARAMGLRG